MLRRGFIDLDNYFSKSLSVGEVLVLRENEEKTVLDTVGMLMNRSVEAAIRGES